MTLGSSQLAELRAIDMNHQRRLFALLHGHAASTLDEPASAAGEPSAAERAELRAAIVADLLSRLTPEQRRLVSP